MKMHKIAQNVSTMLKKTLRHNSTIFRIWLNVKRRKFSQVPNFNLIKASCNKFKKFRAFRTL